MYNLQSFRYRFFHCRSIIVAKNLVQKNGILDLPNYCVATIPDEMRGRPESIYRVPFAEICTSVDTLTQSEESCAEYGGENGKYICSEDSVVHFSEKFSVAINWSGTAGDRNRGSRSDVMILKENWDPIR
jgi:hypothetical protein